MKQKSQRNTNNQHRIESLTLQHEIINIFIKLKKQLKNEPI